MVSPGFIDGHTHMDAQIAWDPLGTCSCWHGVTSVVMGNCGFTLAPAHADQRHLVVRNLERAEDISAEAMAAGIDWTWETFPEYLDTARPAAQGHQLRRLRRPLGAAHLGDGRAGVRGAEATRTTSPSWPASCATRMRAGALGLHHQPHAQPPDLRRPPGRQPPRHLGRGRRAGRRDGRPRRRHLRDRRRGRRPQRGAPERLLRPPARPVGRDRRPDHVRRRRRAASPRASTASCST